MISDSAKHTIDEDNTLRLLNSYLPEGLRTNDDLWNWLPLLLNKTLSVEKLGLQKNGSQRFFPENSSFTKAEIVQQFDLSPHGTLQLGPLFPMSVLERPSPSFIEKLAALLKSTLCQKN